MRAHHAPLLLTFMACVGFRPLTALADGRAQAVPASNNSTRSSSSATTTAVEPERDKECPFYGCPLLPTDVHYNSDAVKTALEKLRDLKRTERSDSLSDSSSTTTTTDSNNTDTTATLTASGTAEAATLTLVGYKGGELSEQINQDRAIVVSPFYLDENDTSTDRRLLGVFDGHAPLGEVVSEFARTEMPTRIAEKLKEELADGDSEQDVVDKTKNVLLETFIELDKRAPAEKSGGCTATVVLQQGQKVYFANAGDSRSFLVAYRPTTKQASVVYISREDKPNLPDERARVEKMGGQVYIPIRGTSRVVYHDRESGAPTGLAMSRSIGDWEAGKLGVIPDPIVDVFDIDDVVKAQLDGSAKDLPEYSVLNEKGEVTETIKGDAGVDDIHIFAVSATDGK